MYLCLKNIWVLEVLSLEKYVEMYNEYKTKLASKLFTKWEQYKIAIPLNWGNDIVNRVGSYG